MFNRKINMMHKLEDIKSMCRICLTQSDNNISIDDTLEDLDESPLISDVLQELLSVKLNNNLDYPRDICHLCHGNIRILSNLKELFVKSQRILEKYVFSIELEKQFSLLEPDSSAEDNTLESRAEDYMENDDNDIFNVVDDELHPVLHSVKGELEFEEKHDLDEKCNKFKEVPENVPTRVLTINVGTKPRKDVKIKWLEGNKFVIERKTQNDPLGIYRCWVCRKKFSSLEKLKRHTIICKSRNVKCDYCSNTFSSKERKENHIRLRHTLDTGEREIMCEICGQTFKNHNARSYHKVTRHNTEGKKYKCGICDKAFYIKNSLSQHLECHSRDVNRVVCPICGKGFHYRGGLFYHMKVHKNERNYICQFCNRRFLTMASLKRHTRIHTGERPYSCSMCSKTFRSIGEVKTHERRHTGQKPHPCKYCPKRFISPYNLKLHVSSHNGSQQCDFCTKSLLNNEALKYHMEFKHNIKDVKVETLEEIDGDK